MYDTLLIYPSLTVSLPQFLKPSFIYHQFIVFLRYFLQKVPEYQLFHGPICILYPTTGQSKTSGLNFFENLYIILYLTQIIILKLPLFSAIVLVSSTSMGLRQKHVCCKTAKLREKNCPFARKTVASWSLCSRRATLWGWIYCGSGIAGGLDGSGVIFKVSHFQPKYQKKN